MKRKRIKEDRRRTWTTRESDSLVVWWDELERFSPWKRATIIAERLKRTPMQVYAKALYERLHTTKSTALDSNVMYPNRRIAAWFRDATSPPGL